MVCQDYFRQLPPELFYINANPLRGRHFVQRSQGCGEDGREEGTATETAGGILSTSRCSRFCAGRRHPVRKLRECEEMTPALFFSQKEGHSSLSHRHVTFRPEERATLLRSGLGALWYSLGSVWRARWNQKPACAREPGKGRPSKHPVPYRGELNCRRAGFPCKDPGNPALSSAS